MRFLLDSSGTLTHALNYDPYGVPYQSNSATTLGFTGEQTDPNDLVYLRSRYYNPRLGTFTSVDPVLGVGGSTGWNRYLYANGNPANLTDPSGTCVDPLSFIVCAAAGGAIIGGTTAAAYDVFVNQGFGGENLFQRNLGEADWGRAGRVGAIGAGIGAVTAASALFAASRISGLITVGVQQGVYSVGFTQAAHAAMWNIGGTFVMDSLAYHGLSGYVETGGIDVGALLREESHNPLLATMFLADFGFSAYAQFQAYGGLPALRARLPRLFRNPFSGPSRQLTMRELDRVVGGSGDDGIIMVSHYTSKEGAEKILESGEIRSSVREQHVYVFRGKVSAETAADAGAVHTNARIIFNARIGELELDPEQAMRFKDPSLGRFIPEALRFRVPGSISLTERDAHIELRGFLGKWIRR